MAQLNDRGFLDRSSRRLSVNPLLASWASSLSDTPVQQPSPDRQERFEVFEERVLGEGSFGIVYRAIDHDTHEWLAVKVTKALTPAVAADLAEELALLEQLDHPHIVRVRHSDEIEGRTRVFLEWMSEGSIATVIASQDGFRLHELDIRRWTQHALLGLQYLHDPTQHVGGIVLHGDISAQNLLLDSTGSLKVSDFGRSRRLSEQGESVLVTGNPAGTLRYMAPETLRDGVFSTGSDIWALACVVVFMASGKVPWSHLPPATQERMPLTRHIANATPPNHHPQIPQHLSTPLKRLLESCFSLDPKERPSASEILAMDYFARVEIDDQLPDDAEDLDEYEALAPQHRSLSSTHSSFRAFSPTARFHSGFLAHVPSF